MNPLTTRVFDLPPRLAAKADPALIAADEQHFSRIAESLEQSIADLTEDGWMPSAGSPAAAARRRWTATSRSTA